MSGQRGGGEREGASEPAWRDSLAVRAQGQADGLPDNQQSRRPTDAAQRRSRSARAAAGAPVLSAIRSGRWRRPSWLSGTRPGSARRKWTQTPSSAASTVIADRRAASRCPGRPSRRTTGRRGRARTETAHGQPREHAAAQQTLPSRPTTTASEVGAAGDDAARNRERYDEQRRAQQGEPDRAGLEQCRRRSACRALVPRVALPVDEVVVPAEDRLADQHGGGDEADLAQRAPRQRGGGTEREGRQQRLPGVGGPARAATGRVAGGEAGSRRRRRSRPGSTCRPSIGHCGRSVADTPEPIRDRRTARLVGASVDPGPTGPRRTTRSSVCQAPSAALTCANDAGSVLGPC